MSMRSALLVTCATYNDPALAQLRSPVKDEKVLKRVLKDPAIGQFEVDVVRDQPEAVVRRRIATFFEDRQPDDLLLLYISGHGVKDDDGRLYFAAVDTELGGLAATAIRADFVSERMNNTRSRRVVLLLDCCYSGAFGRDALSHRADKSVHVIEQFQGDGRVVLTASGEMEYAFEGGRLTDRYDQPSVFTSAIATGLKTGAADLDRDGWVSVAELYDYVRQEVRKQAPNQNPMKWEFGAEGKLYIARSPWKATSALASLEPALVELIKHPHPAGRLGAVTGLRTLANSPDKRISDAARSLLSELHKDDGDPAVQEAARAALEQARKSSSPVQKSTTDFWTTSVQQPSAALPTRPPKVRSSPDRFRSVEPKDRTSSNMPNAEATETSGDWFLGEPIAFRHQGKETRETKKTSDVALMFAIAIGLGFLLGLPVAIYFFVSEGPLKTMSVIILTGLAAGVLAKAFLPGDDPSGIIVTMLLGIGGSFVGGSAEASIDAGRLMLRPAGLLGSILGAAVVMLLYRAITNRMSYRRLI